MREELSRNRTVICAHIPNRRPQLASLNTIRFRLGHESLDVALAYLKGKDAECAQPICVHTGGHAADW